MPSRTSKSRRLLAGALTLVLMPTLAMFAGLPSCASAAAAAGPPPYLAALVADVRTGRVLHATHANRRLRPASLTKLMTLLLALEHVAAADDDAATAWPVSRKASAQPPTRLGLDSGVELQPVTALDALVVASANDVAVVVAEAIAGSESAFVSHMNEAATRLALTGTRFGNASGLPAEVQFTTARDMAVLARHLWLRYPVERARFSRTGMHYAGRWYGTHNPLLGSYRGAGGMKTGFTCRAGFNLVAVAERSGRVLLAVVLGAASLPARDAASRSLLDAAFSRPPPADAPTLARLAATPGQGEGLPVQNAVIAENCLGGTGRGRGLTRWSIDMGMARSAREARRLASAFIRRRRAALPGARAFSLPRHTGVEVHRALVTGVSEEHARAACLRFRETGGYCVIFGPEVARAQAAERVRIRRRLQNARELRSERRGVSRARTTRSADP